MRNGAAKRCQSKPQKNKKDRPWSAVIGRVIRHTFAFMICNELINNKRNSITKFDINLEKIPLCVLRSFSCGFHRSTLTYGLACFIFRFLRRSLGARISGRRSPRMSGRSARRPSAGVPLADIHAAASCISRTTSSISPEQATRTFGGSSLSIRSPRRGMNRRLIVQFDPDEPSMSAPTFAEPDQGPLAGGRKVNARHDLTLGLWRRDCEISRGFPRR